MSARVDSEAAGGHSDPRAQTIAREGLWVALCALGFVILAAHRVAQHPVPIFDDVAWLSLGNETRELGGPGALWLGLWRGTWLEDNRNPLYPMLLSPLAAREWAFALRAQVLGVALGVFCLLAAWWASRRHFGPRVALGVAAMLMVNDTLLRYSARPACEPLFFGLLALAFTFLVDLLRDEAPPRAWLWAGLFAGLAQFTKANGLFLVAAFGLTLLVTRGLRACARPRVLAMLGVFLLVSLPLFVRNVRAYGSPLHQYNNRFLWTDPLDDFSDIFAPGALAQIPSDPATYLKNLTPAKAAARIGTGLLATFAHLGEALGPMGNGEGSAPLTVVLGIVLLLVALVSVVRAPKSDLRSLTIAHAGVFFAFFWFYAVVTSDPRFVFPAALALLPFAVRTLVEPGSEPLALPRPLAHWMSRLLPTAFGLAVLLSLVTSPLSNSPPPGFRAAQDFLVAHVRPGEDLAVDGRTLLEPTWLFAPGSKMHILSSTFRGQSVPEEVMLQELRAQHVRWVLIDRAAVDDGKPRWLFHDRLQLLPDGSLPETNLPQGLTLAYADSTLPRSWLVLEVH